ncbi:MAG: hypothetical protein Q3Y08_08305 [Butyricicoccus sp.]|nr:hypothetical protein [Butyricicoccus sp.]
MKCPQCGIHYDDSERECPMCGARKPAFQKDASRLAKTTGKLARPSVSRWNKTFKPSTETTQAPSLGGNAERKAKGGNAKIVVLVVVLAVLAVNLIPVLFSKIQETVDNADYVYAEPEMDFPYGGAWQPADGSFTAVFFTGDTDQYQVQAGDYVEAGWYSAFQNTEGDMEFPEEYPASDYTWWMISLYPEQVQGGDWMDQDDLQEYSELGSYVSVYQSRSNPDEIYFYDEFGDVPWLEDDTYWPVSQFADEQTVNDRLDSVEPDIVPVTDDELI